MPTTDLTPGTTRPARGPARPIGARPAAHRGPRAAFADRLAGFGARTAVVADGRPVAYGELSERVDERVAAFGGGRRLVKIHAGNDLESLVSYLAALRGRHVAWLVSDEAPGRSAEASSAFDPDLVVAAQGGRAIIDERRDGSAHDLHPELALLLGTSGSTGAPRLVRLSYANLQANAEAIAAYLGITGSERAVTSLPMHYCYGLSVLNSHLSRGAGLLLTDASVVDPAFWSLVDEHGGTSFAGVPHTFDLLERVGFADMELPTLRYVTQAGGRLAPERVRRYAALGAARGWRLVVMYGQTEATARMAYLPAHLATSRPAAIGIPIPGGSFAIRDVPEGGAPGVGEIVYRGPNVMLGYARGPRDLALGRVVHELRTGDIGRRAADGLYEVIGRRSRFVKLFGLRIDLDEVEAILARAGLRAVCAGTDERLAVAVTGDDAPPDTRRVLAARLGIPAARIDVVHMDEIPRLPNGKPDYAGIADAAASAAALDEPQAAPGGAGAADIAAVFCAVLDRGAVDPGDTFSSLGGDSLSYVEMSLALEEALGHLPDGWPGMSVGELSRLARPRRRAARVETNVVLRAAAIVLVVASHMTAFWPAGGAHLLLALAGHSFARFPLAAMELPRRLARSASGIARIAVPTSAWIGLQVLLAGGYSVGAVLLVNNYTGAQALDGDGRWHYWFLEALVQILIVLTALFAIPAVRRLERTRPFAFVLVLLAAALVFRFELLSLGADDNRIFRPHTVAWIFLLGWVVHRATTRPRRLAASALVLGCVPGFFGEAPREAIIVAGLLLVIWVPVVAVPRPLSRLLGVLAAASMYIYLTHWQAFPPLADALPVGLALPATLAAGVVAWLLGERATEAARRTLARGTGRRRRRLSAAARRQADPGASARRRTPGPTRAARPPRALRAGEPRT